MNTPIIKILTVCVVMILLGAAIVPIIDAFNEQEESTTETYTYGDNIIHDVNVSTVIGDIASSGASYTFSEDAGGDWMLIPSYVLRDTQLTYKVLDGAYIYVPDSATTYAQYTVNGTEIPVTGMSLTFTQDTTITDATVYDLTVNVTDMSLPGVVIEHIIDTNVTVHTDIQKMRISTASYGDNPPVTVMVLDTSGNLYGVGKNTTGIFGLGDTDARSTYTLLAQNVVDFDATGTFAFYIDTSGNLYFTGTNNYGYGGLGDTDNRTTWTLSAQNVKSIVVSTFGSFMIDENDDLYFAGFSASGASGIGSSVYNAWSKAASDVKEVLPCAFNNSGQRTFYVSNSDVLYGTGSGSDYALGNGSNNTLYAFTQLATNVSKVYATGNSAAYVDTSGDLYVTGKNSLGGLGTGDTTTVQTFTKVAGVSNVVDVMLGNYLTGVLDSTGDFYLAGTSQSSYPLFPASTASSYSFTKLASNVSKFTVNQNDKSLLYIDSSTHTLYGGGDASNGYLGQSTSLATITAIQNDVIDLVWDWGPYDVPVTFIEKGNGDGWYGTVAPYGLLNVSTWTAIVNEGVQAIYTNPSDSVTISDVRGNVANGVFTPSETGTYLKVNSTNLQYETYYIGDGRTYYVAQNGTVSETKTAPDTTGLSHASLTFTALADPDKIYTVAGTTDSGYEVIIPYTASYDVTETVTKELIPLLSAVPLMLIVVFIVFVVSGLAVRRDY